VRPQRNELELDDAWQRSVFDRLLEPVLRANSYKGKLVCFDMVNPVAQMLQRRSHIDAIAQTATGTLTLEFKIVRWPGAKEGYPARHHWNDFFLETWSCSVPGHKSKGWMATCEADVLLWSQCSLDEQMLDCFPLPFRRLQQWAREHYDELDDAKPVENIINGRAHWTLGKKAPICQVCRDLRVERFTVDKCGTVAELWGTPILTFLEGVANG
jgi:hypothetical protein